MTGETRKGREETWIDDVALEMECHVEFIKISTQRANERVFITSP